MRSHLTARRRGRPLSTLGFVDVLSRTTEKLSLDWPDERRNPTSGSLAARIPDLNGGSCHFSAICIRRSPDPGSSLFPPALLTWQLLTSPTLWVLWSRVTPPYLWLRALWPPTFHPLWRLPGSLVPSFQLSHVGPLPPLSESPTSRPVRQAWPSIRRPSSKPTRRTCSRRWMKGLV